MKFYLKPQDNGPAEFPQSQRVEGHKKCAIHKDIQPERLLKKQKLKRSTLNHR